MREPGYSDALRVLRDAAGGDLQHVLDAACAPVPAWDPVAYLADFSGSVLFPLAVGAAEEDVAGSMAGRAFTTGQPVTAERDGAVRVWVPVTEQASRTGVLAVSVPHAGPEFLERVELLGVFAGLAIAAASRVSDIPYVRRQGREMSLPAGMQWDLLPPLNTRTPGILIAGLLEPAYDIAGDAFDYAIGDRSLDFAIIDGMGHGISSTLLTGLAIGAYRHVRRSGAPILDMHRAIDRALADYYRDSSFATGIIGRLEFATGRLEWSSAGHPPPLLLRGRKVVAELANDPVLPFGLEGAPQLCIADLEPDDAILLYTDGVIEARGPDGELFGVPRLTDLIERQAASGQPPEEVLRRLVRALLDHQPDGLRDDATLLLVQWTGRPSWDLAYLSVVLPQWGSRSGCVQATAGTEGGGPVVNDIPDPDPNRPQGRWKHGWQSWRTQLPWLSLLVKPLRRGALVFILLLVIEYLVVPELVGASKDLYLLGQVNVLWLVLGVALEGLSLFCYAVLTKVLLPPGPKPSLSRLFRIDLSAAAVAHVIPAGTLGTAALGFRLFTSEGISANDAGVMMAAKGLGSTVVLNVLLWLSLVISIPLAGFRPIYGTVAIIGTLVLLGVAAVIVGVTHGTEAASRILHAVGDKVPGLSGDSLEHAIREASRTLSMLARDKRVLIWSLIWASLNWLLDAASLWAFVAAFGRFVNPVELFAAYGIANVAGALPISPGGLGVVDSTAPLLLIGFGVTRSVATLGVIGWRLVNFWLPIPVGALSYVSLKVKPGAGKAAFRSAISGMMTVVGQRNQLGTAQDAAVPEEQREEAEEQ